MNPKNVARIVSDTIDEITQAVSNERIHWSGESYNPRETVLLVINIEQGEV